MLAEFEKIFNNWSEKIEQTLEEAEAEKKDDKESQRGKDQAGNRPNAGGGQVAPTVADAQEVSSDGSMATDER